MWNHQAGSLRGLNICFIVCRLFVCVFAVRLYCVYKKAAARVTAEIMWSEDVNSVSTQILWSEVKWSEVEWSGGMERTRWRCWEEGFLQPEASSGDSQPRWCDLCRFYSCWRRKSGQDRIKPAPTHFIMNLFCFPVVVLLFNSNLLLFVSASASPSGSALSSRLGSPRC